jgi:hypothetical protein
MSLTITQQPTGLQSANNDSYYVVSGTTYGAPNTTDYKFVANVYLNGSASPVCTLKSFPDVLYGYGVFNLKDVAAQLVSYDFFAAGNPDTFNQGNNSFADLQLIYGEEFTSGTTFVQTPGLASGSTTAYLNSSLPFVESATVNLQTTYTIGTTSGSTGGKFLSTSQSEMNAFTDSQYWLYFFNNGNSVCNYLLIKTYDELGNLIGSYGIPNPYTANQGVQYVCVSPYNGYDEVTIFSGPAIWTAGTEASYSVAIGSSSTNVLSETKTFVIDLDCGKYASTAYSVFWLNELGGWSSWDFIKKNETTQTKQSVNYKKTYGQLNANGTYSINTYSPSQVQYYTKLQDSIEMTTDFLKDTDVLFLQGLFSSPAVFIQGKGVDSFGNAQTLIAATIKPNSYKINKVVNQKIYSLTLTVEPSYNDFRQAQ